MPQTTIAFVNSGPPGGVVGLPGQNPINLNNEFFNLSGTGMATVLIHEMWHIAGGGDAVDNDNRNNDATVRGSCGTGSTAQPPNVAD